MEIKKGQNMIAHKDEIFSRPARTWFQTTREKRKAKGAKGITIVFFFTNLAEEVGKLCHISDDNINSSNRMTDDAKVLHVSFLVPTKQIFLSSQKEISFPD